MSMAPRCLECDALHGRAHDPECSEAPDGAAVQAVADKLMEFVCLGGGDAETIKQFARDIVAIVRNN